MERRFEPADAELRADVDRRLVSGIVVRYGEVSPTHRERFLAGSLSIPEPAAESDPDARPCGAARPSGVLDSPECSGRLADSPESGGQPTESARFRVPGCSMWRCLAFVKSWATGLGEGKSGAPASDAGAVPASSLEEAVAANACAHLIDSTRIQTLLTFDEVIGLLGPAVFGLEPEPVPPPAPAPAPAP